MLKNIFITGVGGQGILTVSNIIASGALQSGLESKKSEVHGMSQRGGSVVSQVRFGEEVHSPLIPDGQSDVLMSFEKLEALRYISSLKKDGILLVNDQRITPSQTGDESIGYPDKIEEKCKEKLEDVYFLPAVKVADELGSARIMNIVMLGAFSCFTPDIKKDIWKDEIEKNFPEKFVDMNLEALERGIALGEEKQND